MKTLHLKDLEVSWDEKDKELMQSSINGPIITGWLNDLQEALLDMHNSRYKQFVDGMMQNRNVEPDQKVLEAQRNLRAYYGLLDDSDPAKRVAVATNQILWAIVIADSKPGPEAASPQDAPAKAENKELEQQ